jgi:hypothetical protein
MLESEELYTRKAGEEIVDQVQIKALNRFLLFLPTYLPTRLLKSGGRRGIIH